MKRREKYQRGSVAQLLLLLTLVGFGSILFARAQINQTAKGRIFTNPTSIPHRNVALVLGCSKMLPNGRHNLYFLRRIEAAASLYHAGKADHILVSGDNHRPGYNEPEDMKQALIQKGVPPNRIICDYAGFSTLDSIVRANRIFGQQHFTVVSQAFHNRRAIFIGRFFGLDITGFNADDIPRSLSVKTLLREELARVKTLLDLWVLKRKPRYLGTPIQIPSASE